MKIIKTKQLLLMLLILTLSSLGKVFSGMLRDLNNPYKNVFISFSGYAHDHLAHDYTMKTWQVFGNSFSDDRYINTAYYPYTPKSLSFQIGIRDKDNEDIMLRNHSYDINNGKLSEEEVIKEKFTFQGKEGEITYKKKVQIMQYTVADNPKIWTSFDSLIIKILYAELDGKELKLDKKEWKEIERNCTKKEARKENCVIRKHKKNKNKRSRSEL